MSLWLHLPEQVANGAKEVATTLKWLETLACPPLPSLNPVLVKPQLVEFPPTPSESEPSACPPTPSALARPLSPPLATLVPQKTRAQRDKNVVELAELPELAKLPKMASVLHLC